MKSNCWHVENDGWCCRRCDDARARWAAQAGREYFARLDASAVVAAARAAREAEERAQDARRAAREAARRGAL